MLDISLTYEMSEPNQVDQAMVAARKLYQQASSRSWIDRVRLAFNRGSYCLFDLVKVRATYKILDQHHLGVQTVPISRIRGSSAEGRSRDFDADFRPLKSHNEARWLSVAAARQRGVKLPLVILIQVGEIYFVQDGHHRISVARALGQKEIQAKVTIWQVAGPLPWETAADEMQPNRCTGMLPQRV